MDDLKIKKHFGLAIVILSICHLLTNINYYFVLISTDNIWKLLCIIAVDILVMTAGVILVKGSHWKIILRLMCAVYALTAISLLCGIPDLERYSHELVGKKDEMLPGLNALSSVAVYFEIMARSVCACLYGILIVCILFVSSGKKGKIPSIILAFILLFSKVLTMGPYGGNPVSALFTLVVSVLPELLITFAMLKGYCKKEQEKEVSEEILV